MQTKRFLQIGGIINLLFVAFHLSFWKIFNWKESLASLSQNDGAVMQVLNIHTAYVLAVFSILSLVFANEICITRLGRVVSLSIAGFWILRGANQLVFWGATSVGSWSIFLVCLGIALLYILPATTRRALAN